MPIGFELRCAECGKTAEPIEDGFMSLLVVRDGKETLHGLPHPGDDRMIKQLGEDREKALREGRLLVHRTMHCQDCGLNTDKATVWAPAVNAQASLGFAVGGLGMFLAGFAVCGFVLWQWGVAAGEVALCAAGVFWIAGVLVLGEQWAAWETARRGRCSAEFEVRKAKYDQAIPCQHCGSDELVDVRDMTRLGQGLRCPSCHKLALRAYGGFVS